LKEKVKELNLVHLNMGKLEKKIRASAETEKEMKVKLAAAEDFEMEAQKATKKCVKLEEERDTLQAALSKAKSDGKNLQQEFDLLHSQHESLSFSHRLANQRLSEMRNQIHEPSNTGSFSACQFNSIPTHQQQYQPPPQQQQQHYQPPPQHQSQPPPAARVWPTTRCSPQLAATPVLLA
jgi:hypothetical protein